MLPPHGQMNGRTGGHLTRFSIRLGWYRRSVTLLHPPNFFRSDQ